MPKSFVARVRWARLLALVLALVGARLATRLAEQTQATDAAIDRATEASRRAALVEARAEAQEKELGALRLLLSDAERRSGRPPAIDGSVLSARTNVVPAVALLSVGRRRGVERGYHLTVYRGPRFVAKVVVEAVEEDAALARVLFTAEGEEVRGGDLVATRLDGAPTTNVRRPHPCGRRTFFSRDE
jgi:hypothetical protein